MSRIINANSYYKIVVFASKKISQLIERILKIYTFELSLTRADLETCIE